MAAHGIAAVRTDGPHGRSPATATGLANAIARVSANMANHPNDGLSTALGRLRANQARIGATGIGAGAGHGVAGQAHAGSAHGSGH